MKNASEILFRCSSLGYIMGKGNGLTDIQKGKLLELSVKQNMTEKQCAELNKLIEKRDNPELPETCKTHLVDVFISAYYKRSEEITSKYLDKGNEREQDAITLFSRLEKRFFKKNGKRLKNEYITGEPDLFIGEVIEKADEIIDTKTSWGIHTFLRSKQKEIEINYYWQGMGYMDLTGAKKHTVAYCLVNGTERAISDEKRRLAYAMGIIDTSNPGETAFKDRCKQIEINHIFDLPAFKKEYPYFDFDNDLSDWHYDIDMSERCFKQEVLRDEAEIIRMHIRVNECRKWIDENLFSKINQ